MTADLLEHWTRLVGPGAEAVGRDLLARWSEQHRAYHDVAHLRVVLEAVDLLAAHAVDLTAVRIAAWFHDAVHEGEAGADEEASAVLAERVLPSAGVPSDRVAEVARLVRLTAGHDPAPGDADGAVLCDADLAVLGSDPDHYATYVAAVRQEYAGVPDDAFRRGRAAVLERLLGLDPLFRTATGQRLWADRAAANLRTELDRLRGGASGGAARPP